LSWQTLGKRYRRTLGLLAAYLLTVLVGGHGIAPVASLFFAEDAPKSLLLLGSASVAGCLVAPWFAAPRTVTIAEIAIVGMMVAFPLILASVGTIALLPTVGLGVVALIPGWRREFAAPRL